MGYARKDEDPYVADVESSGSSWRRRDSASSHGPIADASDPPIGGTASLAPAIQQIGRGGRRASEAAPSDLTGFYWPPSVIKCPRTPVPGLRCRGVTERPANAQVNEPTALGFSVTLSSPPVV